MSRARAGQEFVGKTIVRVEMRPFAAGRHSHLTWAYDPVFHFADGTSCVFDVQETETTEYGVEPRLRSRGRS